MIKVCLDTNIIISSIFWRGNSFEVVRKGILGEYKLIISTEIIDEVVDKLRNKFQFPEDKIEELIDVILTHFHVIEPISKFDIVRDQKDNKIIECAFDGQVDYIITGDLDLLVLKEFKEIRIINAKEFLEII